MTVRMSWKRMCMVQSFKPDSLLRHHGESRLDPVLGCKKSHSHPRQP